MLNSFTICSYYPVNSKVHNIHPLTKIICSLLAIIATVNSNSILFILFITVLISGIIYISKIPFKAFTNFFNSSKYFFLSILLINIIFSKNILLGLVIVLKMLIIIVISEILLFTTNTTAMIKGLELFLKPLKIFKISSKKIALSLAFAIHFIPLLFEQSNRIIKAQASRGLIFNELSFKDKMKASRVVLFPLFSLTLRKADLVADSLQVRNFNLNNPRTAMHFYNFNFYDIITILFFGILLLISFII